MALGQRWLALAEQSDGETKVCHQVRAWYCLILARRGLAGPNRAEIDELIAQLEGGAAFEARRRQWLERLGIGLEHEGEIDCAAAARTFPMAETFDPARSWRLSLEFQPCSTDPHGQVFFWGDDRGGRDPLFVRLGDARLELGIGDSYDAAKAHSIRPPLQVLDADRWLHLEVTYQQSDRSLAIELEHERIATGVCPFEPAADRPMPIWIGGASADSQRFAGKVRMVTLRN
ncbi:MAG TPA: hypothetical protein VGX76_25085 [Pirellulales bacterium]|nr:hypothetical protein [Pirellulales bacterium]